MLLPQAARHAEQVNTSHSVNTSLLHTTPRNTSLASSLHAVSYPLSPVATLVTVFLLCSVCCFADYTDEQLYQAYMERDIATWQHYIDEADWSTLSVAERKRLLNYEYGFVAVAIDSKIPNAEAYLTRFRNHVAEAFAAQHICEAHYCMYMSSIHAYDFLLNRSRLFSSGLQSFKMVKRAAQLAPDDPYVLTLKANVDFYAPSAFGGDKEAALKMFSRAKEIFQQTTDYQHIWNYASLSLCIAQCYEKAGEREKAIEECHTILAEMPDFSYVRDEYLPKLTKDLP